MDRPLLESTATHAGRRTYSQSPQRRAIDSLQSKASSASLRSPSRPTSPVKSLHGHVRQQPSASSLASRSSPNEQLTTPSIAKIDDRDQPRTSQAFVRASIPCTSSAVPTAWDSLQDKTVHANQSSADLAEPTRQNGRSLTQMNDDIERLIKVGRQALGTKIDVYGPENNKPCMSKTASDRSRGVFD